MTTSELREVFNVLVIFHAYRKSDLAIIEQDNGKNDTLAKSYREEVKAIERALDSVRKELSTNEQR